MKQIRYIIIYAPELYDIGPFPISVVEAFGLVVHGYVYDHEGD